MASKHPDVKEEQDCRAPLVLRIKRVSEDPGAQYRSTPVRRSKRCPGPRPTYKEDGDVVVLDPPTRQPSPPDKSKEGSSGSAYIILSSDDDEATSSKDLSLDRVMPSLKRQLSNQDTEEAVLEAGEDRPMPDLKRQKKDLKMKIEDSSKFSGPSSVSETPVSTSKNRRAAENKAVNIDAQGKRENEQLQKSLRSSKFFGPSPDARTSVSNSIIRGAEEIKAVNIACVVKREKENEQLQKCKKWWKTILLSAREVDSREKTTERTLVEVVSEVEAANKTKRLLDIVVKPVVCKFTSQLAESIPHLFRKELETHIGILKRQIIPSTSKIQSLDLQAYVETKLKDSLESTIRESTVPLVNFLQSKEYAQKMEENITKFITSNIIRASVLSSVEDLS